MKKIWSGVKFVGNRTLKYKLFPEHPKTIEIRSQFDISHYIRNEEDNKTRREKTDTYWQNNKHQVKETVRTSLTGEKLDEIAYVLNADLVAIEESKLTGGDDIYAGVVNVDERWMNATYRFDKHGKLTRTIETPLEIFIDTLTPEIEQSDLLGDNDKPTPDII